MRCRISSLLLLPAALGLLPPASARDVGHEADAAQALPATRRADPTIPFGIEAVTGYRSEYVHRGFKLAGHTFDFQLETEIALSDSLVLGAGGWYATELNGGDFSEATGFVDLSYEWDQWSIGAAVSYHAFSNSLFQDGFDTGIFVTWAPGQDLSISAGGYYDHGSDGWYGRLEGAWSRPLGNDSFISLLAGTSWLSGYYARSGWNDIYARFSWTYAINDRVSLTPFIGSSISVGSGLNNGSNRLYGGLWFEVNF